MKSKQMILLLACIAIGGLGIGLYKINGERAKLQEKNNRLVKEVISLDHQSQDKAEQLNAALDELEAVQEQLEAEREVVERLKTGVMEANKALNSQAQVVDVISSTGDSANVIIRDGEERFARSFSIVGSDAPVTETFKTIELKGPGDLHGETVRVQVLGEIHRFQVIEVEPLEDGTISETNVYEELDTVTNSIILLDTYLPEGMPFAKLKWKNADGDVFEQYLSFDGYGFSGRILWCK